MGQHLSIDIGNSRTKVGEFKNRELLRSFVLSNEEVAANSLKLQEMEIDALILSSVNQKVLDLLPLDQLNCSIIELKHSTPLPIKMKYQSPETLGKDRIAVAVAANAIFPNQGSLVIDIGTCITYDLINEKAEYLGGAIAPGIQMRLKAMHFGTDSLPLINWQSEIKQIPHIIGKTTIGSMLSGVINGILGEMRLFIKENQDHWPEQKILLTGGDADFFEKALKNGIFADPNLVLKGLNEILLYNLSENNGLH